MWVNFNKNSPTWSCWGCGGDSLGMILLEPANMVVIRPLLRWGQCFMWMIPESVFTSFQTCCLIVGSWQVSCGTVTPSFANDDPRSGGFGTQYEDVCWMASGFANGFAFLGAGTSSGSDDEPVMIEGFSREPPSISGKCSSMWMWLFHPNYKESSLGRDPNWWMHISSRSKSPCSNKHPRVVRYNFEYGHSRKEHKAQKRKCRIFMGFPITPGWLCIPARFMCGQFNNMFH